MGPAYSDGRRDVQFSRQVSCKNRHLTEFNGGVVNLDTVHKDQFLLFKGDQVQVLELLPDININEDGEPDKDIIVLCTKTVESSTLSTGPFPSEEDVKEIDCADVQPPMSLSVFKDQLVSISRAPVQFARATPRLQAALRTVLKSASVDGKRKTFNLVSPSCRESAAELFRRLDKTGDNLLRADDFVNLGNAESDTKLKLFWQMLVQDFDFDDDRTITPAEFLGHFIAKAMLDGISQAILGYHSLGDQLLMVKERFCLAFMDEIHRIRSLFDVSLEEARTSVPLPLRRAPSAEDPPLPLSLQKVGKEVTYIWECKEQGTMIPWPGTIMAIEYFLEFAIPVHKHF